MSVEPVRAETNAVDVEALRALEPALRRYFRRRARPDEIDDLVQEVFVALCARRTEAPVEDLQRYVFTVAAHALIRRGGRRAGSRPIHLELEDYPDHDTRSPERLLLGREGLDDAIRVISALPPRTRQVFLLHRFEDRTYQSIARDLGISSSAVEKHIMNALRALLSAREAER